MRPRPTLAAVSSIERTCLDDDAVVGGGAGWPAVDGAGVPIRQSTIDNNLPADNLRN